MLCFGGVCVDHLFSFLCCVFGVASVLLIFLVFCVVFLVGSVLLIFLVFCVVFFVFAFVLFVIVLFLVCPILPLSVSGLSVLHCPFSFVYRLITHYNVVEIGETKQRDHFIAGKTSVSLLLGT